MDFHNFQRLGGLLSCRLYRDVHIHVGTNLEELLKMQYLWAETNARELKPNDVVRVKANTFSGKLGKLHNGRILKVLQVKDGDVITESLDSRKPFLSGSHYSPFVLEKRITIE